MFLLPLAIAILLTFLIRRPIKKYANYFYGATAAISLLLALIKISDVPVWVNTYILDLFRRGTLATALWVVVMITGVLPNRSVLRKQWLPIRGELSIMAAILTLCHNITYGKTYYVMLFRNPSVLPTIHLIATIISVILLAIMIPLTVISFPGIRKKMPASKWKKIQKLAYIFYGLLYIHIMLVMMPSARNGNLSYRIEVLLYSVVFIGYAVCRVIKAVQKGREDQSKIFCGIGAGSFVIAMAIVCCLLFVKDKPEELPKPTEPEVEQMDSAKPTNPETTQPTDADNFTSQPTEPQTTDPSPTESKLTEPEPTEPNVTEPRPTEPKPTEPKPTDPKPTEPKATEPKPTAPRPTESEPTEPKATEPSPTEPKATEPKPTAPRPTEPKPTEPKPTTPAPTEPKPTEAPTEAPTEPPTEPPTEAPTKPPRKYKDGTFTATATNDYETVTVSITIENDVITNVTAYSSVEGSMFFGMARDGVVPSILANQSANVDTVSGATFSSNSIKDAARSALSKAMN